MWLPTPIRVRLSCAWVWGVHVQLLSEMHDRLPLRMLHRCTNVAPLLYVCRCVNALPGPEFEMDADNLQAWQRAFNQPHHWCVCGCVRVRAFACVLVRCQSSKINPLK
jgi:hypothetical protein